MRLPLRPTNVVVGDAEASEKLRDSMRAEVKDFDLGPPLEEILSLCTKETGMDPPVRQEPLPWAQMETPEEALKRVREHGDRQMTRTE